jgi:hypothetical protein
VILAGRTELRAGAQTVLTFDGTNTVPVFVLGVVPAFPGSGLGTGSVTVVTSSSRLFRLVPPTFDPRRRGAARDDPGAFTSSVWSRRTGADLRAQLAGVHVEHDGVVESAASTRTANGLVGPTWAAAYALALGAVLLALALAAGLVLALRLADRDSVSDVVLRRMGYRPRDLARARAWEVGYAVATALVAACGAVAALVLAPTSIDAAAGIPPLAHPRVSGADVLAVVAVLTALVLSAWAGGTLLARRRPVAEVLRAGE